MASGLGKTVTAALDVKTWLSRHGGRVLYLCHQKDILEQAKATFEAVLGPRYKYGYFHGHERSHRGATVVFASFQTMHTSRKLFGRNAFTYIVVDESHHGQAETYLPTLEYFKPKFLLGITATPDRRDLRDIRKIYGSEVFSLPLETALARGLLARVDYRLLTDDLQNLDVLNTPIGRLSVRYLNKKLFVPRRDEEIGRIIRRHMRRIDSPRVMVFCASIKHCEALAKHMPESVALHSHLTHSEQSARLRMFRDGLVNVVLTVDKFNEGVDIPEANLIVFLRSTSSRTIFFQQLGRGLRKVRGKEKVVILDFVANCERLQIINDLWEKLGKGEEKRGPHQVPIPVMDVDTGNIHFTHVAKQVLDVLAAIRGGYTREMLVHQLKVLAKALKRTPKQIDVAKASTQGKCAGTGAFAKKFGSFSEALIAAGFPPSPTTHRYTKATVLKALRELAKKLGRVPIQDDVKRASAKGTCPSVSTIANMFGSYTIAVREAGLSVKRRYGESRESLIKQLQTLAKKLGRIPTYGDIHAASRRMQCASATLFFKEFGGLYAAREAAGLGHLRVKRDTSKKGLILQLRSLAKELKRTPTIGDIERANRQGKCSSASVFHDRFGGISNAQAAAGLSVQRFMKTKKMSDADLIRQLQGLAKKLRRTPVQDDIEISSSKGEIASLSTYANRFGSYSKAVRLAGLNSTFRNDYTKAEVQRELKALAKKIKKTPAKCDVARAFRAGECTVSTSACIKLFGTYNSALEAAGVKTSPMARRYTREEIIRQLKRLTKELGRTPSCKDVQDASKKGRIAHPASISHKFGSFNNGLRAAGIPVTRDRSSANKK
jgi:superfamily II DNA or RNA helicase